ncbi:MAG: hypothetical protein IJ594_03075 [Oscillospiraceae bacterium]|nr:hypothetical protein [Oscillospiraceae bacterium]
MMNEELARALNGIDERYLLETQARMDGAPQGSYRPRRRALRTVLIAAALAALLSVTAYAAYEARMDAHSPQPGEAMVYHYVDADGHAGEGSLYKAAFVVRFEAQPGGPAHAMRFGWLPEDVPAPDAAYTGGPDEFWAYSLADCAAFDPEETAPYLTRTTEIRAPEAAELYVYYHYVPRTADMLDIILYDSNVLCERDLILGINGGTAAVVGEGTLGGRQYLEVALDVSSVWIASPPNQQQHKFLLLFDPAEQMLIQLSGSYDFPVLERIAEELEVERTGEQPAYVYSGQDYLVGDLGRG